MAKDEKGITTNTRLTTKLAHLFSALSSTNVNTDVQDTTPMFVIKGKRVFAVTFQNQSRLLPVIINIGDAAAVKEWGFQSFKRITYMR